MELLKDLYYHLVFFIYLQLFVYRGGQLEHSGVSVNFYLEDKEELLAYIYIEDLFNFERKVEVIKRALLKIREIRSLDTIKT